MRRWLFVGARLRFREAFDDGDRLSVIAVSPTRPPQPVGPGWQLLETCRELRLLLQGDGLPGTLDSGVS